jgi:hypothetical protein
MECIECKGNILVDERRGYREEYCETCGLVQRPIDNREAIGQVIYKINQEERARERVVRIVETVPNILSIREGLVEEFKKTFNFYRDECKRCGETCGWYLRSNPPKLKYTRDLEIGFRAYKKEMSLFKLPEVGENYNNEDLYAKGKDEIMKSLRFYRGNCIRERQALMDSAQEA